jgi:hypothetical protein
MLVVVLAGSLGGEVSRHARPEQQRDPTVGGVNESIMGATCVLTLQVHQVKTG